MVETEARPFYSHYHPDQVSILYIEDDTINQEVLQCSLMDKPHIRICTAGNLEESLTALEDQPYWPDLILLDNHLVGMTGHEVGCLRAEPII